VTTGQIDPVRFHIRQLNCNNDIECYPAASQTNGDIHMKNLILIGGVTLLTLNACSGPEKSKEPTSENAARIAPVTGPKATDGGPVVGTFEVTSADGVVLTQTTAADGTVTTTDADGKTVNGKYTQNSPNRFCITNDGETEATCFMEMLSAEGVWTAVNEIDAKDIWTVRRIG
jgi:hypothetical protein